MQAASRRWRCFAIDDFPLLLTFRRLSRSVTINGDQQRAEELEKYINTKYQKYLKFYTWYGLWDKYARQLFFFEFFIVEII